MKKLLLGLLSLLVMNSASAECTGVYNHQFKTLQGKTIDLCEYQNKPILVVNTASKCGYTPQFEELESLYSRHKSQLLVIGFPSNDFRQEYSSDKEIGDFCKNTYKVEFPMVTKTSVTGPNANPMYKQLIQMTGMAPSWNFYKYLVMPGGEKIYAFNSDVEPNSTDISVLLKPYLK